jgi:hypothetical protein
MLSMLFQDVSTDNTRYSATVCSLKFIAIYRRCGDRSSTVVKVLRYKSEGRCFDPKWCHGIFH